MNILLFEDNRMNRRVVGEMLATAGLRMDEAEDALSGLALVDCNKYDLILMDIRMPGLDGLAATRQIRARHDEKANTPIVVLTADSAVDLRTECLRCGADGVLTKPVMIDGLFDTISKVLAGRTDGLVLD